MKNKMQTHLLGLLLIFALSLSGCGISEYFPNGLLSENDWSEVNTDVILPGTDFPENTANSPSDEADTSTVSIEVQTPTPEPTPYPTPAPFQEYDISLLAVGDNLMHLGVVVSGKQEDGTYNFYSEFDGIRDFLKVSDISIINQETPFAGDDQGFSGFPRFNSPTAVGDAIAESGFNVVLCATNHTYDRGLDGLINFADFWDTKYPEIRMVGITGTDTSHSRIRFMKIDNYTFAFLNYTYGDNLESFPKELEGHLNMLCSYDSRTRMIDFTSLNPQVLEDIQLADSIADVVIVCPHWGTEYKTTQSKYQDEWAKAMTEAGADLIIGTHPHVPEPVEIVESENGNNSLCYYSLGNYASTQKQGICMLEGMAWVNFHVTKDGISVNYDTSGVVPLVNHYTYPPTCFSSVYLLEDYTEELAAEHGIKGYGYTTLHLEDLQNWSEEIFGSWVLTREDILKRQD